MKLTDHKKMSRLVSIVDTLIEANGRPKRYLKLSACGRVSSGCRRSVLAMTASTPELTATMPRQHATDATPWSRYKASGFAQFMKGGCSV